MTDELSAADKRRRGKAAKAREGVYPGGPLPYGLEVDEWGRWRKNPEDFAIVEEIFQLRGRGLSLRAIANRLGARGIPTPKRGEKWSAATIMRILKNPIYTRRREDVPLLELGDMQAVLRAMHSYSATGIVNAPGQPEEE